MAKATVPYQKVRLSEKFNACMMLHSLGDCIGHRLCEESKDHNKDQILNRKAEISRETESLDKAVIDGIKWKASSSTIMNIAIAVCFIQNRNMRSGTQICMEYVKYLKRGLKFLKGRKFDPLLVETINSLDYKSRGSSKAVLTDASFAVRSPSIGLRFSKETEVCDLIRFCIDTGSLTHSPPGYLSGLQVALFVSYGMRSVKVSDWGAKFLEDLAEAKKYFSESPLNNEQSAEEWELFEKNWKNFLELRHMSKYNSTPVIQDDYGNVREQFYLNTTGGKWPVCSAMDSVLIAFDSLLVCNGDWKELCKLSMLHGGQDDGAISAIACSFFGSVYGFNGVQLVTFVGLEYKGRLESAGNSLYEMRSAVNKRVTETPIAILLVIILLIVAMFLSKGDYKNFF